MTDIVIVGAKRTPIGSFQGQFNPVNTIELGAAAIRAAVEYAGIDGADISEVIMGCVLPAGLGQAPARQASLKAGVPVSVGCMTINKVCGSGLKAVMLGHDAIKAGSSEIVVAGGMESMSNAPYLLRRARGGLRIGHGRIIDHMFWDALQNPYDEQMMGIFGEMCADKYEFSREQQDEINKFKVEQMQFKRKRREVRKNLRQDIEQLGTVLTVLNMTVVPLIVLLAGLYIYVKRSRGKAY